MPRSTQVPTVSFLVSGTRLSLAMAKLSSLLPLPTLESRMSVLQPRTVETARFRLFPFRSPLLWESRLISFPPGTEMFHFPGLASADLCIQSAMLGHDSQRVSPFRDHRIKGCLAPPRCLSQLTTSFIASQRQGIRLLLFISCLLRTFLFPFPFPYSIVNEQLPIGLSDRRDQTMSGWLPRVLASTTSRGRQEMSLVEVGGIEPSTLCVQSRCSPS